MKLITQIILLGITDVILAFPMASLVKTVNENRGYEVSYFQYILVFLFLFTTFFFIKKLTEKFFLISEN